MDLNRLIRLQTLWDQEAKGLGQSQAQAMLGHNAFANYDPTQALIALQRMKASPDVLLRFMQLGQQMNPGTTDDVVMQVISRILAGQGR